MNDFVHVTEPSNALKIKIIGLGGAGSNIVDSLELDRFETVTKIAVNTDTQALNGLQCKNKIHLGATITRGLGTGGDFEIGKSIVDAELNKLTQLVEDADLLILVAGLGGGTGSALIVQIAALADRLDTRVLAFSTIPFSFEGLRRRHIAEECLGTLRSQVHGLIALPNDILLQEGEADANVASVFAIADNWIGRGILSICTLLLENGLINQDFGSLCSIFRERGGKTLFGIGFAKGENYLDMALEDLFLCPLLHLEDRPVLPDRILVNLIGSPDLGLGRINEIMASIAKRLSTREDIAFGAIIDPTREQSLEICVLGKSELESTAKANQQDKAQQPTNVPTSASQQVHRSKLKKKPKRANEAQDEFTFDQLEEQRGYFEKTDFNEYRGEDLDVPTYLRRGIRIKLKG